MQNFFGDFFMFPSFILFGKEIGTYTIMAIIGALLAGWLACRAAKRRGLDENDMLVTLLIAAIGVFIGSHLLYGLTNLPVIIALIRSPGQVKSLSHLFQWIFYIFGGGVFYGGLLGGLSAGTIYLRRKKLPLGPFSDIAAPVIALFHCFGRIGCFLGGCCYGVEVDWGIVYTNSLIPEANGVPRLPVQLIEAGFNLLLFCLLAALLTRGRLRHRLLLLYLTLYPTGRFVLEFFRGDAIRGFFMGLSTSQWISCLLLLISLSLWTTYGVRSRRSASVKAGLDC